MNERKDEQRLLRAMDEYAGRAFPGGSDLWPEIARRARHSPEAARRRRSLGLPAQVLVPTGLLLVLVLAVFIAAPQPQTSPDTTGRPVAATPRPPATSDPATSLRQTANGYTVDLYPVSADANRIVLTYTVAGPSGPMTDVLGLGRLADAGGTELAYIIGGTLGGRDRAGNDRATYPRAMILAFDASAHADQPQVDLKLTLNLARHPEPVGGTAEGSPGQADSVAGFRPVEPFAGPFVFSFGLPMNPLRRVAEVRQTVEDAGVPVTLERVVITASETRAVVTVGIPGITTTNMPPFQHVTLLGGPQESGTRQGYFALDDNTWAFWFSRLPLEPNPLMNESGEWTLKLEDVTLPGTEQPVAGRWAFSFPVPPLVADAPPAQTPAAGITPPTRAGGSPEPTPPVGATAAPTPPAGITPITQTANGYTIALYPLFADANQIVVSYTLRAPGGAPIGIMPAPAGDASGVLSLRDEAGADYPTLGIEFPDAQSAGLSYWEGPTGQAVLRFDAGGRPRTGPLRLRLSFDLERFADARDLETPAADRSGPPRRELVAGPFNFDFAMPVDPRLRVAEIHQPVESGGMTIFLERVLVTPGELRAVLRISPEATTDPTWMPGEMSLVRPSDNQLAGRGVSCLSPLRCTVHLHAGDRRANPLLDYDGPWTLRINSLDHAGEAVTGPWDFNFRVPQMTAEVSVRPGVSDAWLRVETDGKIVLQQVLAAGSTETFTATDTIRIRSGRGDLVRVTVNGVDKGYMGGPGLMIVTKEWDKNGGERIIEEETPAEVPTPIIIPAGASATPAAVPAKPGAGP